MTMGNVVARTQAVRVLSNPTTDHSDSILTTLLQYPSLISASVTWNRQTLWHLAAQSGHLQLIKALPDAVNHIFHQLRSDRRRRCISKFGQDGHAALRSLVNNPDVRGATPLMVAAYYGHQECICKLLQIGADAWQKVGLCVAMQSPDRLKRRWCKIGRFTCVPVLLTLRHGASSHTTRLLNGLRVGTCSTLHCCGCLM